MTADGTNVTVLRCLERPYAALTPVYAYVVEPRHSGCVRIAAGHERGARDRV